MNDKLIQGLVFFVISREGIVHYMVSCLTTNYDLYNQSVCRVQMRYDQQLLKMHAKGSQTRDNVD